MRRATLAAVGAILIASLVFAGDTWGRSDAVLPYPIEKVWPTAVRFLRVDRRYAIQEKDEAAGYALFDVPERGKIFSGSMELVRTADPEGRDGTRAVFALPDLPRHFETLLLDKLTEKLEAEYGKPPPAPPKTTPKPEKKPTPDAGEK